MIQRLRDALAWRWWFLRGPLGQGVISRAWRFPKVFATWHDARAYSRVMLSMHTGFVETIHAKLLGEKHLYCRAGTSDAWVFWDVFFNQFQSLPREMPSPRCVVDLGANVGYTAAYYATVFPNAKILAVEMDYANYEIARQNLRPFAERCCILNAAVWDRNCQIEYCGTETQGYRAVPLGEHEGRADVKSVAARDLTSLFDEYALDEVDFLKMDIEGAEAVVFKGSLEWLCRVKSMKIELHTPMTYNECMQLLTREGFHCRRDDRHNNCLVAIRKTCGSDTQPATTDFK